MVHATQLRELTVDRVMPLVGKEATPELLVEIERDLAAQSERPCGVAFERDRLFVTFDQGHVVTVIGALKKSKDKESKDGRIGEPRDRSGPRRQGPRATDIGGRQKELFA